MTASAATTRRVIARLPTPLTEIAVAKLSTPIENPMLPTTRTTVNRCTIGPGQRAPAAGLQTTVDKYSAGGHDGPPTQAR